MYMGKGYWGETNVGMYTITVPEASYGCHQGCSPGHVGGTVEGNVGGYTLCMLSAIPAMSRAKTC